MQLPHRPLIASLIGTLLVAGFFAFRLTRPFAPFRYFAETNITPFTSTIIWTSHQPLKGCLLVIRFPLEFICDATSYNHHLTIPNLRPTRTYTVIAISGLDLRLYTIDHRFIPNSLPALPNAAYGRLVTTDQAPIAWAIVRVNTPRGIKSTVTSAQGTWSIDLGNTYTPNTIFPITIDWKSYHLEQEIISLKEYQPTPDFIIDP